MSGNTTFYPSGQQAPLNPRLRGPPLLPKAPVSPPHLTPLHLRRAKEQAREQELYVRSYSAGWISIF